VLARKEAIEAQHEDVKRRIDAERSLRDSEQPAIAAALAQRRELEAQRNERSAKLEDLRASTKGTKEELLALRDEVHATQVRVSETRATAEATRAMIITSPDKIKTELVTLEAAADAEQSALDAAELRRRLIGRQLEVIGKADKDVTKAMTLMAEAEVRRCRVRHCTRQSLAVTATLTAPPPSPRLPPQTEAVKLKRIQKDEKARKSELEAVSSDVDALKAQLEHVGAARRRIEEKLQEVRASAEARLAAQAKELEAVWREAAEHSDDTKASVDARRAAEAEEMRLERRKEALISQHSAEVADMVGSLKRLAGSLAGYNAGITAGLARIDAVPRQGL
jgi:chromosome segregation ATPase